MFYVMNIKLMQKYDRKFNIQHYYANNPNKNAYFASDITNVKQILFLNND